MRRALAAAPRRQDDDRRRDGPPRRLRPSRRTNDTDTGGPRTRRLTPALSCRGRGGGSSVGRAPGCGPGGRGFESRPPPCFRSPEIRSRGSQDATIPEGVRFAAGELPLGLPQSAARVRNVASRLPRRWVATDSCRRRSFSSSPCACCTSSRRSPGSSHCDFDTTRDLVLWLTFLLGRRGADARRPARAPAERPVGRCSSRSERCSAACRSSGRWSCRSPSRP